MHIKGLIDEDFVNYKLPAMFIICPHCSFKCNLYAGRVCCQNIALKNADSIKIDHKELVQRYLQNPITKAVVFGGLEPFDSFTEMMEFISELRKHSSDDVVIYSGYEETDLTREIEILRQFDNIVVKFGRFIPDAKAVWSDELGVKLASENQYAKRLERIS